MTRPSDGPVSRVDAALAYRRQAAAPGALRLDANEGAAPDADLIQVGGHDASELVRRYPDASPLEDAIASRFGLSADRVVVTAGADEAIDRCLRAYLAPGRTLLAPDPTFEMFERYAALGGGGVRRVPWTPGPYPIEPMLDALGPDVDVVAVVTPNNPTGEVGTIDDVRRLSRAAPGALVVLDHAYAEFADEDLTRPALELPNVVVLRTFSKAWGLAGCRLGYALGPAAVVVALRAAGGPYPVAGPSIAAGLVQVARGPGAFEAHVVRVRLERARLFDFLAVRGARPRASQANFVYADLGDRAADVQSALLTGGIVVRRVVHRDGMLRGLRITVPGEPLAFDRLLASLDRALPVEVA